MLSPGNQREVSGTPFLNVKKQDPITKRPGLAHSAVNASYLKFNRIPGEAKP
jgi:hypothetical protein